MQQHLCCLMLLLLITAHSKIVIQNIADSFTPKDEFDYVNYLKLILGRQDESSKLSENLVQLATENRYSLGNSVERVVLAFIPYSTNEDKPHKSQNTKQIQFKGRLLQQLVFETPQLFIITSLPSNQQQRLHQLIEVYKNEGKVVHVIRGEAQEVRKLGNMVNMESPQYQDIIHHPTRRLNQISQTSQNDSTYLIKFFFSIMFILIIVGTIGFIAENDGKKDTLLYAKFIADVGNR